MFNAANEVAACAFLERRLGFLKIASVIAETMERLASAPAPDGADACEAALSLDATARRTASEIAARRDQAA